MALIIVKVSHDASTGSGTSLALGAPGSGSTTKIRGMMSSLTSEVIPFSGVIHKGDAFRFRGRSNPVRRKSLYVALVPIMIDLHNLSRDGRAQRHIYGGVGG